MDCYTKIALHKSFCIFCGHILNTYPLDSNLSFGQPRPEILHLYLGFFKPLPTRDSLILILEVGFSHLILTAPRFPIGHLV